MDANVEAPAQPSVMIALLLLLGAVPFVGALLLAFHLLGIGMVYMGFLFLFYWMGIMQQSMKVFMPSLVGGLAGIGMAWLLLALPAIAGPIALYGAVALLAGAVFCLIRGQFGLVVNNSMMLYLTVATIPDIKIADNVLEMAAALLVAAGYSFAVATMLGWVMARRAAKAPTPAALSA
jgi:hypothetical protein